MCGIGCALFLLICLSGCEKPINPNDLPVSHWADPRTIGKDGFGYADACSVASAQAIVKAGLPFPNYGTKDELSSDGKTIGKRISTVDVWLGGVRFVFPADLVASGAYPAHNPNRFTGLRGTLPNFYPTGPHAPVKDGMGAMVDVTFTCSMEQNYGRFKRSQSNEEGIQKAISFYQKKLATSPNYPGTVIVNRREDLGMIEVLMERQKLQPEATYFPFMRELRAADGSVSPIACGIRKFPDALKRYGGVGHTCSASIPMTANASASVTIYVAHLESMPTIFDQVQQVITNAQKAGE